MNKIIQKEKEGILNRFFETIYEISNPEFQDRVWVKGLGPECSSFEEVICDFFDNGEAIMNNYRNYNITDKQYDYINTLSDLIQKYCDIIPEIVYEEDIIKDPKWKKIRKMAKKVLKAFDYEKEA